MKLAKFGSVGVVNTLIDFVSFTLLVHALHWQVLPANVVSYSLGILNSFIMNKTWTFQDRTPFVASLRPFLWFILINLSSLGLSSAVVWLIAQFLPAVIAKAGSVGIVFCWNYSLVRLFVFARDI